jgi:hypothetical protein
MKTIDKIFVLIFALELIVLTPFLFIQNNCESPCRVDGLLNPMNILNLSQEVCAEVCVKGFYPITFLILDIIILTVLVYVIIKLIKIERR